MVHKGSMNSLQVILKFVGVRQDSFQVAQSNLEVDWPCAISNPHTRSHPPLLSTSSPSIWGVMTDRFFLNIHERSIVLKTRAVSQASLIYAAGAVFLSCGRSNIVRKNQVVFPRTTGRRRGSWFPAKNGVFWAIFKIARRCEMAETRACVGCSGLVRSRFSSFFRDAHWQEAFPVARGSARRG